MSKMVDESGQSSGFDRSPAPAPLVVSDDWFSQVVSFLVKHGMLDTRDEYDINDVMGALADNYEPVLVTGVQGIADDYMTKFEPNKRVQFILEDCASYIDALHQKHKTPPLEIGIDTATVRETAASLTPSPETKTVGIDIDRQMKETLFAALKTGRGKIEYGGVLTKGGKAWITFEVRPEHTPKPWVDDETEILQRLANGDTIVFSMDGDMAWFTKGDRAFVGNAIMSLREKGYLLRKRDVVDDDDDPRGIAAYDTITAAGRAALATSTEGRE